LYFYLFENRDLRQRQTNSTAFLDIDSFDITTSTKDAFPSVTADNIVNNNVVETSDETIILIEHRFTPRNRQYVRAETKIQTSRSESSSRRR
jgi:hypothetical protein